MSFHYPPYANIARIIICAATTFLCFLCTTNAQHLIAYNNSTAGFHGGKKPAKMPVVVDAECRDPQPDELATINKARQVIDRCIGGVLQQMGWLSKNSDQVNISIATHPNPYRPMFICSRAFDMTISPDPNSTYGKKINDSIRFYQAQSSQAAILRSVILGNMQNIKIRIEENSPYIKTKYDHAETDKYTVLHVPGLGYAYRLTEPGQRAEADVPPDYKTYILIGNWTGADMNANTYVKYPFIHKTGGAYIETLTVQIAGPAVVADQIIHKVDWQGLSAALAK